MDILEVNVIHGFHGIHGAREMQDSWTSDGGGGGATSSKFFWKLTVVVVVDAGWESHIVSFNHTLTLPKAKPVEATGGRTKVGVQSDQTVGTGRTAT